MHGAIKQKIAHLSIHHPPYSDVFFYNYSTLFDVVDVCRLWNSLHIDKLMD